jgi:hypothetical protein
MQKMGSVGIIKDTFLVTAQAAVRNIGKMVCVGGARPPRTPFSGCSIPGLSSYLF